MGELEARTFRVGVVTDPLPGHERYAGWLSIPYLAPGGETLTMRFRCLAPHDHKDRQAVGHGKYASMFEEPSRVFNVGAVVQADDELHIAEGEFDAMVLTKVGMPAIAIPGADGWRRHHGRMVAGFNRVYIWGDPDEAGSKFKTRVARAVRSAVPVRTTAALGDVTETYEKGGADALWGLYREVAA